MESKLVMYFFRISGNDLLLKLVILELLSKEWKSFRPGGSKVLFSDLDRNKGSFLTLDTEVKSISVGEDYDYDFEVVVKLPPDRYFHLDHPKDIRKVIKIVTDLSLKHA